MSKFSGFTKIGQFRQVVRDIKTTTQFTGMVEDKATYDSSIPLPTITFQGTVKLHGTNAGVAFDSDGNSWVQSRKNKITALKDNAGFAFFVEGKQEVFDTFNVELTRDSDIPKGTRIIFGEWCGKGIQKGVAISELDKMFVIFGVKIVPDDGTDSFYLPPAHWDFLKSEGKSIYNINDYQTYSVDINFEKPELSVNRMNELTMAVEAECPVGKAFGISGVGEGIVWQAWIGKERYIFKVKGEKHSVSKVKTLSAVDVEKMEKVSDFVEYSCTPNRLLQASQEVDTDNWNNKKIGDFIRWVVNDIAEEEGDTMRGNNLEPKDVNSSISKRAREYFQEQLLGEKL